MVNIIEGYSTFISSIPQPFGGFVNIFFLTLLIVIYAVVVWKVHRILGTKNILKLNLSKYNKAGHPLYGIMLYISEYIIIVPLLIFLWFAFISFFLILFTENLETVTIVTVSAILVAAIRLTAYVPTYGEKVARQIASLLPFNLLAISLLAPETLNVARIATQLSKVPGTLGTVSSYLIFIVCLELLLRFFDFFLVYTGLADIERIEEEEEE